MKSKLSWSFPLFPSAPDFCVGRAASPPAAESPAEILLMFYINIHDRKKKEKKG